ncbi:MAG: PD40 domain-containing protein [Muribaculaceae bacterium]|nr:PD40 domain-containing protein [Muribaculaceae bacterium]
MKFRHIITISLLCLGFNAMAQQVEVGKMTRVNTGTQAYHPIFTTDGNSILTSTEDYRGLSETNLATGKTTVLSTEPRAGMSVMLRSVNGKSVNNAGNLKINLVEGNNVTTLTPNGENERYLWPALSPDGSKIAYTVSGKGTWVYDIATGTTTFVGKYRAPQWMGNDYVVAMNDRDDGYQITGSTVIVCAANGSFSQQVTPDDMVAMFPSATEGKIAFHTLEGEIYIMDITITK